MIGLSWQSSPAVTEIEEVVTDWLRQMLGLSPAWSGVIQDTASTSTLVALICARERATNYALARGGLQGETRTPRVYVSAHAHSSVDKGALLAGFGRDNLRLVPFDGQYAMRADALAEMIEEDLANGDLPCAIVATVGTTATTAIDPIAAIAEIARRHGIWLHVDAAMAGSAMILPECRWMWEGVEGADSLVINAHKWLGAPFDCSVYYVRDPEHLMRVMSTNPSFLQSSVDGEVKNLRDWGIPLGRRFRALKLWFIIREQGVSGLQKRLRRDMANARWLAEQVAANSGLAGARAGPFADRVRASRTGWPQRRGVGCAHNRVGRGGQSLRRRLSDARRSRRALDGARVHRRVDNRKSGRRRRLGGHARGGGGAGIRRWAERIASSARHAAQTETWSSYVAAWLDRRAYGRTVLRPSKEIAVEQLDRITQNPEVMGGKACIRGMRVTVGMIVGQIGAGRSIDEVLTDFPYLEREDIFQALRYAAWRAEEREVLLAGG